MDRIQQMEVFIQVLESGSFTKAAEALNMPRSTVSTVIQTLENRLGVQLLHRTTRKLTPTQDGLRYLDTASQIVQKFNASERMFHTAPHQVQGRLRIDMPSRIARRIVIPALPDFLSRYPKINIELSMKDRLVDLVAEGVDCVIRVGELSDSELICKKLGDLAIIYCASPAYLAEFGMPANIEALSQHHLIHYAIQMPAQQASLAYHSDGETVSVPMQSRVTVDNAEAYIASAIAGIGIIEIPKYDVQHLLENNTLQEVLPDYQPNPIPLSFLYPSRKNLSLRVNVFQEWISQLLAEACLISEKTQVRHRRSH
ncbi:LysR family transcriptional regulator [Photobacterium halotolerans]|uniref:LysR family transcriptional regulator n=2 Tax=Photobacterium halotolerans TaxID=265726 RepID=A0A7X5ATL5_9GAMM|nr:LysR family transcriptional regulator [Photobacterium halotolerans]NAW66603.1 LysR family transcriptional regulator [Photobacterium halotolerans]NAW87275.1 LysR family transcriptional regulator [Photobacterium halotolerans]